MICIFTESTKIYTTVF